MKMFITAAIFFYAITISAQPVDLNGGGGNHQSQPMQNHTGSDGAR
jgi:hypothetical protein